MSLGLSKRCVSTISSQHLSIFKLAGPSRVQARCYVIHGLNPRVRHYTVAVTRKKQSESPNTKAVPPKGTSSPSKAPSRSNFPKAPTKLGLDSRSSTANESSSVSPATAPTKPHKVSHNMAGGVSYKVPEKKEILTDEEQMDQIEQILLMSKLFPTADPWGQRVETLDVTIPYSVMPSSRGAYPSFRAMFNQFIENRYNAGKNATSMLMLAQANAIPSRDLEATGIQKFITQWPWRIFTTNSLRPGAWLAPLRKTALTTYQQLNTALAQQNDKVVKQLTASTYYDDSMRLLRKKQPGLTYIWRFHREVTPTRVISIRGTEGYLATEEPKFGNRMMVHALIRVDTEQSLEIYDKRGKPVHTPPANMSVAKATASGGNWPAERRRVTEYLVFEKRMWYDGPWVIREQLWEAPGKVAAI